MNQAHLSSQHPYDPSCIFCRIAVGEISCFKIFESPDLLCFLDIGPVAAGHSLIIPKAHYKNVFDVPAGLLAALGGQLPVLARAVTAAVDAPGCHILLNNGSEAMQSVFHLHYHIIPRKAGDSFHVPWHPGKLESSSAAQLIAKIKAGL